MCDSGLVTYETPVCDVNPELGGHAHRRQGCGGSKQVYFVLPEMSCGYGSEYEKMSHKNDIG